jgi:N-acyl-D-aspartate/D-glutamate deacylase
MTSLPTGRFGLAGRGTLTPGAHAELVVFDPAMTRDVATYEDPKREPEGVRWVVINGQLAYDCGRHTGVRPGRLLRFA